MALTTNQKIADQVYLAYFSRPADTGTLQAFGQGMLNSTSTTLFATPTLTQLQALFNSAEGKVVYGATPTISSTVELAFNMVGRTATGSDLNKWVAWITDAKIDIAQIPWEVLKVALATESLLPQASQVAWARLAVSYQLAEDLSANSATVVNLNQSSATQDSCRAVISGVTSFASISTAYPASGTGTAAAFVTNSSTIAGQTFTLTTGIDNIVGAGGNDTVNAYAAADNGSVVTTTLNAADAIDLKGGSDTLNLTIDTGGVAKITAIAGATLLPGSIQGVENFYVRNLDATKVIDFSTITGEQQAWADRSTQSLTFDKLGTGAVVGVKGNGSTSAAGDVLFAMATATDAVSLVFDGGVASVGGVTTYAAASFTDVGNTGAGATVAKISSTGASNNVGTVALASGNTVTSLTVDASANLAIRGALTGLAATAAVTVAGAATSVNLGAITAKTIDASGLAAGGLTATVSGATSIKGGAGKDAITLGTAPAGTTSIALGAGDDKLMGAAGVAPAATVTIDGGDGFDTLAATLVNAGNGSIFKNFEALDFVGLNGDALDAALLTGSSIQKLVVSGATTAGSVISNVAATAGLEITAASGSDVTVGVKDAAIGTADSYTVTLANSATIANAPVAANFAAGKVVLPGIETVNIVSGGTNSWNSLTVGNAAADFNATQKIVVTGASNLDLTIGSAQTLVGAATSVALTSVDASAATGKVSITTADNTTVKGAVSLLGGSAADTFVVNNAATAAINGTTYTITTGAGADTVNVAAAAYGTLAAGATTGNITTVTDFAVGDTLVFSGSATFGGIAQAKVDVGAATTLADALDIAAAGASGTNIAWFQYAGSTYVVEDNTVAAGGIAGTDVVVKLTGLVDLANATFAANAITL